MCCQCNSRIEQATYNFSIKKYKFPLCEDCQIWFIGKIFHTTKETLQLYFALKHKGLAVNLEKHYKYKKAEIIIAQAKVHIEVDRSHGQANMAQALLDLKNLPGDARDPFLTLKVPEVLVKFSMEQTTDLIQRHVIENMTARQLAYRKD
jgi:hypothetical protein